MAALYRRWSGRHLLPAYSLHFHTLNRLSADFICLVVNLEKAANKIADEKTVKGSQIGPLRSGQRRAKTLGGIEEVETVYNGNTRTFLAIGEKVLFGSDRSEGFFIFRKGSRCIS